MSVTDNAERKMSAKEYIRIRGAKEHIEQKSSELEQKYRQHETEPRITAERSNSANYQTDNSPNTPTNSALPEINLPFLSQ